ncbi:MAG: hypothetical protein CMQ24_06905 [Gammaproteobacteria bacterium]|nr:hypothetical protein [Gammaproteobacteria bacterium]
MNLELDAGVPGMHPTFAELGFEDPARRVTDVDGVRSFVRLDLWQDLEEHRCVRSCIRFPDPLINPWLSDAVTQPGKAADAYRTRPELFDVVLSSLRRADRLSNALLD